MSDILRICREMLVLSMLIWMLGSSALASLEIHFLDVGQGDAAIVLCDGKVMMIDGGKPENSQFIYSYLTGTLGLSGIDVMVLSHPHSGRPVRGPCGVPDRADPDADLLL